ncbi:MAG: O-methyltransferase [Flammeovirgaceae bacterium]
MVQTVNQQFPTAYKSIDDAPKLSGFTMASDVLTGSLLRTLAGSKPRGKFLELGTGTRLSTSWILDGMDEESTLTSVDNDPKFLEIAQSFLGDDKRLKLICVDGGEWIEKNRNEKYDYIFADTWHGKYLLLEDALSMLNKGGFYIVDDMLPQPNWPEGHQEKASRLIDCLEHRKDLMVTKNKFGQLE